MIKRKNQEATEWAQGCQNVKYQRRSKCSESQGGQYFWNRNKKDFFVLSFQLHLGKDVEYVQLATLPPYTYSNLMSYITRKLD